MPKRRRTESQVGSFLQQYGRKAQAGREPNDRQYDRKVESRVARMSPMELATYMEGIDPRDMTILELQSFHDGHSVPGVRLKCGDKVELGVRGIAEIEDLATVRPEPRFVVAFADGTTDVVSQSDCTPHRAA